jgi:hypothetical protein
MDRRDILKLSLLYLVPSSVIGHSSIENYDSIFLRVLIPLEKYGLSENDPWLLHQLNVSREKTQSFREPYILFSNKVIELSKPYQISDLEKIIITIQMEQDHYRTLNEFLDIFYSKVIRHPSISDKIFPQGDYRSGQISLDWEDYNLPPENFRT